MYKNIQFEVQIRTIIQDAWSVLDHKIKYKKSIPLALKRRINSLAALFETADREFYSIRDETEKLEKEIKEKPSSEEESGVLNVFNFSKVVEKHFPEFHFYSYKIDGFVDEILKQKEISESEIDTTIQDNIEKVNSYNDSLGGKHALNPYTIIRHILYLYDRESFSRILYDCQRESFETWLGGQ